MTNVLVVRKVVACLLVAALACVTLVAQKKEKEERWSGIIQRQSADKSTLTVRKGNIEKTVVYNSSTQWTQGKKTAERGAFKDGERVICVGKYDEKGQLVAARIDLRPPR